MKNRFILLLLTINLTACGVFRPASRNSDNLSASRVRSFIGQVYPARFHSGHFHRNIYRFNGQYPEAPSTAPVAPKTMISPESKDYFEQLQFKYAILTNTPVEELTNQRLLIFMDQWYGAPYHYGGTTKDGIDCSAFTSLLMARCI